jgi:hypothetical protein
MINKKKVSFRTGLLYPLAEKGRIEALRSYQILDSSPENDYDEITFLASKVFKCPISFISFIDEDRLWLKSSKGFTSYEMERDLSFCGHTILDEDLLIVNDTLKDERFYDNPFVLGSPYVRFYAAAPIISATGYKIGTLCIMDNKISKLSESEKLYLKYLANRVVKFLELRRKKILLAKLTKESRNHERFFKQNDEVFYQNKLKFNNEVISHDDVSKQLSFINVKTIKMSLQNQSIGNSNNMDCDEFYPSLEKISKNGFKKIAKKIDIFKFFAKDFTNEEYQRILVNELIARILGFYQEKMKSYEIKLNVTLEMSPNFKIECKPSLTMRAFLHLLNNSIQAIKFKKYKWIHINVRELAYDVEFSISDNSLRLDRYIGENQNFDSVSNLEELKTENGIAFEGIKFLNELVLAQGGQVSLDSTVENTKILFYLPKRNCCFNN